MISEISADTIDNVIHRARRQQRLQQSLLAFFGVMTLASILFGICMMFQPAATLEESLPAFAISIISAVLLVRSWLAVHEERTAYAALDEPGKRAINAALQATRRRILEYRRLAAMLTVIVLPLFGISLWQLWAAGKMSGSDVASLATLIVIAYLSVSVNLVHRIRNQLRPHADFLQSLNEQVDE